MYEKTILKKLQGIYLMTSKTNKLKPFSFSKLQLILTIVYVVALMISNLISARIFNFFAFSMTSAVIVFPITYILSDLFSEVYGYNYSRLT